MNQPLDFQNMILTLQHFWAQQGCLIWQPYYTQVGAGTYNPATILRVLGPEPWRVAYVEPSVRPDDGRYGDNPYRLQQHYQFQVILKPDPGNPQELYLQSLEALGIDPRQHDIRFVEDNWESPALGAWGLGWEVWLDGQEITQFTYFQQAGSIPLETPSVEITYGLERIAMPLQRVRNFRDLRWNSTRTYGDVNYMGEKEHSTYYFDVADVDRARQMYDLYEKEANSALAQGLVLPALDYVLKCSHTFNILDTRGAVGVTERQALFGRMRDLTHRVSEAYLAQRQQQEFPWLAVDAAKSTSVTPSAANLPVLEIAAPFLFEIGTEELPAGDLDSALAHLRERIPTLLANLRLEHGLVTILGTPRRLVISVADLASHQPDRDLVVKGPPATRAFDAMGVATKAGAGFALSKGVSVQDLQVREMDGGSYVVALVHEIGRGAVEVLAEALPKLVASLKFDKSMRWNASGVAFSRPIRWFLALLGSTIIPFSYAGLQSSNNTRGLRFHQPEEFVIIQPADYFTALQKQGILLDPAERRQVIAAQVRQVAAAAGGAATVDESLLDEVTQLVEAPTALLGHFDESHLKLPAEVLISVMKKHQRYFPVVNAAGQMLPHFIAVRNGDDQALDVVADGNEQVIGARFADATFFINHDLHKKLEDFLPRLGTLTFQLKLGSMLDKSHRIEQALDVLMPLVGLVGVEVETARRAAHLCKADLVTHMVVEMTALQGVMGRYYALHSGESEAVAQAIYEHYLPRSTGDSAPASKAGLVISLADRLDTLVGLFAAGLSPTGTKDPFAQRRAALGLVQALIAWDLDFNLREGLAQAASHLPLSATPEVLANCLDFIVGRLRSYLIEIEGLRFDRVDAVLAEQPYNPAGVIRAVRSLTIWTSRADWNTILPAYARCVRITRDQKETYPVNPAVFVDPAEQELFTSLQIAESVPHRQGSVEDFLQAFIPLIPQVNRFFESVLVMDENPAVRANRLGLLQRIAALAAGCADLSNLEGF